MAAAADSSTLAERVRKAVKQGERVDCAPEGTTTPWDLDAVDDWDERAITAELLVGLCTRPGAAHPRNGVQLQGAHIIGTVDLAHAVVEVPVRLELCRFDQGIDLTEAHIRSLRLGLSAIPTLMAAQLESDHTLYLTRGRLSQVTLTDARIDGRVDMVGAKLRNDHGPAFDGDGLSATGGVYFSDAKVMGALRLVGAEIGGQLSLPRAELRNDHGPAFNGDGLSATGGVYFDGAKVMGALRLVGAEIGGQLSLYRAELRYDHGPAFHGDRLSARASVFFDGAKVMGELRLLGALIGGQLSLKGAELRNDHSLAFTGDGLSATGGAFFDGADVIGELRLPGADIRNLLSLNEAELRNDDRPAFHGQEMRVDGPWFFQTRSTIRGDVDLTGASVRTLVDRLCTWPERLFLDGFSYDSLTGAEDTDTGPRLNWIRRNHHFVPGVYDQLADVYRHAGHDEDARAVAIAREEDRRRRGQLGTASRIWNRFLGVTVAHGYQPWKAGLTLLGVLMVSTGLFLLPAADAAMVPTRPVKPAPSAEHCTPNYECFEPWLYSLDVVLPVVDLHQESNWLPSADRPWGDWYRDLTWALIAIGWLLTTALVAAIGTVWRR